MGSLGQQQNKFLIFKFSEIEVELIVTRCCESVKGEEGRRKQADKNRKAALKINTEDGPKNVQTATDSGADGQQGETRQVI